LDLLERVKRVSQEWIKPGHIKGQNTHNVSATITIRESEWPTVGDWMWENRKYYNGLSVLPYDGGSYVQAPFEECDKQTYDKLMKHLESINLNMVIETQDETNLQGELACAGGACSII
jgi:ribonucleoside-diphosphate reductase alpha chain